MKRTIAIVAGLAAGVLASLGVLAAAARTAPEPEPFGPPIGPAIRPDTGAGEMLLVVVGGVYPSLRDAETANAAMSFGDLQGYYVVPVGQFQGFRQQAGEPGDFALVSVFRTDDGAREFVELAGSFGHPATILPERVRSLGGLYAGLGQEAGADGSGPLLGPTADSLP
jgi:hypothetical protein